MRYIIATTAFALIAGIALGLVVSKGLDGSVTAAPPTQAVEEQNLDGSGLIAVHEQGVADVNVVSMPPQDSGPFEFTDVIARLCDSESQLCIEKVPPIPGDVSAELTTLSSQGWELVSVTSANFGVGDKVIFTLSRPVP